MTTNPQIERMAEALFSHEKKTMGDAWYHPSETFKGLGEQSQRPWILAAQAAYDASDARLVPMLVEALKNIQGNVYFGMSEDTSNFERSPNWNYIYEQTRQALAALPEEYR